MKTFICKFCGNEFGSECSRHNRIPRFCNMDCYLGYHKSKRIKINCEQCGKEFEIVPCLNGKKKLCSKKCVNEFHKGRIPWNKGLKMDEDKYPNFGMRNKKHSEHSRIKMSVSGLRLFKENPNSHPMLGRENKWGKHTKESIEKMCLAKTKPKVLWKCPTCNKIIKSVPHVAKNRTYCSIKCVANSKEVIEKNRLAHTKEKVIFKCIECGKEEKVIPSILRRNKRFCSFKCMFNSKSLKEKRIKAAIKGLMKRPTSFEKKIADLCLKHNLQFFYKGDGGFLINYKNPDFVNFKERIVIEVFHSWFKIRDYGSIENYKKFCRKRYEPANWKVIFIDENEVDIKNWEEVCLKKIIEVKNEI